MENIDYLGKRLSEKSNISKLDAIRLIKLSIRDEFGSFKPLNEINLDDLKIVIQNSLVFRLNDFGVSNPGDILDYLLKEIITNQIPLT